MYRLEIFKNEHNDYGPYKTLVATCENKEESKLEELWKAIAKADIYSFSLIDLEFEKLKKKVINLCNKNAGLEIAFSELPSRTWLGDLFNKRCFSPIFSLERKEAILLGGEKQSIPTKCILLYGINDDDLTLLFNNDKKKLNELYEFILRKTSFLKKIGGWLRKNWMSLTSLIISIFAIAIPICCSHQSTLTQNFYLY